MNDKKFYLIYKITNIINNKIYIGKHITADKNDNYMGSGTLINKAIKKHGRQNFKKEILFECKNQNELNKKEEEIVDKQFISRIDTYNIRLGDESGWECINRLGANNNSNQYLISAQKIKECPEYAKEFRQKVSEGLKKFYQKNGHNWVGKKHTEETKRKIGEASSKHQRGSGNSQYGTCWIYNLILQENKKIPKENLQKWTDKGWTKGRKMSFT